MRGRGSVNDTYAKLFGSILTSSIWSEDDKTRIMWITLLAMSDKDGYVSGTIPGLAAMSRMSLAEAEKAVARLEAPDKYTRTPDHDGRRIEQCDGGWLVLNYVMYREIGMADTRKSRTADRQARFRARRKAGSRAIVTQSNATVTQSNAIVTHIPISYTLSSIDGEEGSKGEPELDAPPPSKDDRKSRVVAFGEFANVKLTPGEHAKLTDKHGPEKLAAGIDLLGAWMKSTGKRRTDHYACLNEASWVWAQMAERKAGRGRSATSANSAATDAQGAPKLVM